MSKEDETTPGPKYDPKFVAAKFKNKFGKGREEVRSMMIKGMEKTEYCRQSPGHLYDIPDPWSASKRHKSAVRGYRVPGESRGLTTLDTVSDGPTATTYNNTNEIMRKHVQRNPGSYKMGSDPRKIEFAKFSSIHNELVAKGIY